ncbi:MAG: hypothetical protein ACM3MD_05845 [Betaproteobacteria bacterium]
MKKSLLGLFGVKAMFLALSLVTAATANAQVHVNINVPLPGLFIPAPPGLIVIPGTYVYYPPDVDVDIFFYHGYWYRPYRGGWYIANGYNGPWRVVGPKRMPRALVSLPHAYRRVSHGYERMPYGHVQKNWQTWERERYWDNRREERGERKEQGGRAHGHGRGHGNGRHERG